MQNYKSEVDKLDTKWGFTITTSDKGWDTVAASALVEAVEGGVA